MNEWRVYTYLFHPDPYRVDPGSVDSSSCRIYLLFHRCHCKKLKKLDAFGIAGMHNAFEENDLACFESPSSSVVRAFDLRMEGLGIDFQRTCLRTVLLLLLRIRSAHREILGFPMGAVY